MRAVYLIALSGLAITVGVVFALGRGPTVPVLPATAPLPATALPPPPPPPPVPAQQDGSPGGAAPAGLACIQNALGGVAAFAGVSSLRIIATTKVTVTSGPHPLALKLDIGVQFPDRFRYLSVPHDSPAMTILSGFDGDVPLSNMPRPPDEIVPTVAPGIRSRFVQQILMRLPRELPGVRLSQRTMQDAGQERLAIEASGPGLPGLDATLLADPRTCRPVAIQYSKVTAFSGRVTERVALSQYRRFGGILFPTVLRTTQNGEPWSDEYISEIRVNASFDPRYFRAGGT